MAPSLFSGGGVPKACIFVDGENFRYSLADLFPSDRYHFTKERYLPDTDWHAFFRFIAAQCDCELVRAYWYVTDSIDFRPFKIPHRWSDKAKQFKRSERYTQRIDAAADPPARREVLQTIEEELMARRREMEARWKGQRQVLFAIEKNNDRLEVRRFGSIAFDLIDNCFETEKGVDTQLATDLIMMSDIYDVAILVSGDADYLPPIAAIKSRGKIVYSVCFLNTKGDKLPGGARRLEAVVDSSYEVPFAEMRERMGVKERGASKPDTVLKADPATDKMTLLAAVDPATDKM